MYNRTFGLLALAFSACATTATNPSASAPSASNPASERRLTEEEEMELLAYKAECERYSGLSHYEAEMRALEQWRGNTEKEARYSECLAAFVRFDSIRQEETPQPLPRGQEFASAMEACPQLPSDASDAEIAENAVACIRAQSRVLDQMGKDLERTSNWLGIVMEHDSCVAEFEINENFFDPLFCYEVERVLTRYGNGG